MGQAPAPPWIRDAALVERQVHLVRPSRRRVLQQPQGEILQHKTLGATGLLVSELGFGASPLGNEFRQTDPAEGMRAVHAAIDQGINFFDVSPYYGRTLAEERLGIALEGRRTQVVLATKCGRYDAASFDFSAARLRASIDESLSRLRTDYIDLWQAHDVEFVDARQIVDEAIPAMRRIQQQGKVRFIGITGLQLKVMRWIAERAPVDTFLSYCRYNLLIDDLDPLLTGFARERNMGLINASPLHMGVLTERGAPAWHPAPREVQEVGAKVVQACESRGLKVGDVALRFCLDHPYAASTLVGMSTVEHVERNIAAIGCRPPEELMAAIRQIVAPVKNRWWPTGLPENWDQVFASC
jgi:L-galactose dehydrogenase